MADLTADSLGGIDMKRFKLILVAAVVAVSMLMPSFSFAETTSTEPVDSPAKVESVNLILGQSSKVYDGKRGSTQVIAIIMDMESQTFKLDSMIFETSSANAGTYSGEFHDKKFTYTIKQAPNSATVSPASKTYKYKKLKKKSYSFYIKTTSKNGGKVTYKSSSKRVKVSSTGKVTVVKKAKKGTYKVAVTVAAKGNYGKVVKYVTVRVK